MEYLNIYIYLIFIQSILHQIDWAAIQWIMVLNKSLWINKINSDNHIRSYGIWIKLDDNASILSSGNQ
jgi:hypothetical protein